jgi:hypothetical protein
MIELHISCDCDLNLTGLTDNRTEESINDATVTGVLKKLDGTAVDGADSLVFSYVDGSDGNYRSTLPSTVSLVRGQRYFLEVTISASGRDGFRRIQCAAIYHDET